MREYTVRIAIVIENHKTGTQYTESLAVECSGFEMYKLVAGIKLLSEQTEAEEARNEI